MVVGAITLCTYSLEYPAHSDMLCNAVRVQLLLISTLISELNHHPSNPLFAITSLSISVAHALQDGEQ